MLPRELPLGPISEVARAFGTEFATRIEALEPGRWAGPVESSYGLHLVLVRDLVPALAVALMAGMRGAEAARRALFALTAAWLAGGVAGYWAGRTLLPATVTSVSFLVVGALTAADRRVTPTIVAALAGAIGLLHGWLNGAGIAEAGREALSLAGIGGAVFVLVAIVAACVVPLRSMWARTVVRVIGSWVAAVGLLMLGWGLRARG